MSGHDVDVTACLVFEMQDFSDETIGEAQAFPGLENGATALMLDADLN
jgi:hypothetical protein